MSEADSGRLQQKVRLSSSQEQREAAEAIAATAMDSAWSSLPSNALTKILVRLEREDVARSCLVCRYWNKIIASDFFQRSYRKQHRSTNAWVWLAACMEQESNSSSSKEGPDGTLESPNCRLLLVGWNLHYRKCYRLLEIPACAPSRCHPKKCWFDFAAVDGIMAWACRHTLSSIRVGNPLRPSSIKRIPDLPPFPDNILYEFRLGLALDGQSSVAPSSASVDDGGGFKLVILRLGWPHAESPAASVVLMASVYRSCTRQWEVAQVKVNADVKRWGASVVCRGSYYVLLRPPGKRGPITGLLSYNFSNTAEPWNHLEVGLPSGMTYEWHDQMDLIDRGGNLVLVHFSYDTRQLSMFQAEEISNRAANVRASNSMMVMRWVTIGIMPPNSCRQFCEELGNPWNYKCRGWNDYIFFLGHPRGFGYVYWIPRRTWHRVDMSMLAELDQQRSFRYLFPLGA